MAKGWNMPISSKRLDQASAIVAAMLLAGCTSGGSPFSSASSVEVTFVGAAQTWDLNKDNVVSCDEWKKYTTDLHQSADANRDGAVSRDEYSGITRQDKLFETVGFGYFDGDNDGRLATAEFIERPNPAFGLLDKNKDCRLEGNELVQTRAPPPKPPETYGETKGPGPIGR